jgi:hypothetical protein
MTTDLDTVDSSVDKAIGYELDCRISIPRSGKRFFSSSQSVYQLWGHTSPYPVGTGALSWGVKCPGREADHSLPSGPEIKNNGAMLPLYRMFSWSGALVIKYKDEKRLGRIGKVMPDI